jgi:hypothetical protein
MKTLNLGSYARGCPSAFRLVSDPPAVPRLLSDCHTEVLRLMGHTVCILAGRLPSIQSPWAAFCRSRKWMSGHAIALAHLVTDRLSQIGSSPVPPAFRLQDSLPMRPGIRVFSLDKYVSSMSPGVFAPSEHFRPSYARNSA